MNPTFGRAHNHHNWCRVSDGWYIGHWVYSCEKGLPMIGEHTDDLLDGDETIELRPESEGVGGDFAEEKREEEVAVEEEKSLAVVSASHSNGFPVRSQSRRVSERQRRYHGSRCKGCTCEIGGYGYLVNLQGVQFVGRFENRTLNDSKGIIIDPTGVYHGGVVKSVDTGQGTFYFRHTHDVLTGMWESGKIQYGSVLMDSGTSLYTGSFRLNKPDGLGVGDYFTAAPSPDQWEQYMGSWKNCDWVGPGRLTCTTRCVEVKWEDGKAKEGAVGLIDAEGVDDARNELRVQYVGELKGSLAEGQGRMRWEAATAADKQTRVVEKKRLKEEKLLRQMQHRQRVAGDWSSLPGVLEEQQRLATFVKDLKAKLSSVDAADRYDVASLVGEHSSVFHGRFQGGRMQGQGRREWRNGDVYDGAWQQGICNGYGRWKSADQCDSLGDVLYAGGWKNDKEHGVGTLINTMPLLGKTIFHGRFNEGLLTGMGSVYFFRSKRLYYVGRLVRGAFDGEGLMQLEDGSFYLGGFVDGQFKGAARWVDTRECSVYTGRFKYDYKHGGGRLVIHDPLPTPPPDPAEAAPEAVEATDTMSIVEAALSQCQHSIRLPQSFGRARHAYLALYNRDQPVLRIVGEELDELLEDIGYYADGRDEDADGLVREEQLDCAREERKRRMKKKTAAPASQLAAPSAPVPLLPPLPAPWLSTSSSSPSLSSPLISCPSVTAADPGVSQPVADSSFSLDASAVSASLSSSSASSSPSSEVVAAVMRSHAAAPLPSDDGLLEKEKEVQPPQAVDDVDDGMQLLDHYQRELQRLSQRSKKKGKKESTVEASVSSPSTLSGPSSSSLHLELSLRQPASPLSLFDKPSPSTSLRRVNLDKAIRLCQSHGLCSFTVTGHLPADDGVKRCVTCSTREWHRCQAQGTTAAYVHVEVCMGCLAAGCHRGHDLTDKVERPMEYNEDMTSRRDAGYFYCSCGLQPTGHCKTALDDWRDAIARAAAPDAAPFPSNSTSAAALHSGPDGKGDEETAESGEGVADSSPLPVLPPLTECPRPSQFVRRAADSVASDTRQIPSANASLAQQSSRPLREALSSPLSSAFSSRPSPFFGAGPFAAPKKRPQGPRWVKVDGKWQEENAGQGKPSLSASVVDTSSSAEMEVENVTAAAEQTAEVDT